MVLEIEHARKSGRGKPGLFPQPVLALRAYQVLRAARHFGAPRFARRHQREHSPGGLKRGARGSLAGTLRTEVAVVALTPATVCTLHELQPAYRAQHTRMRARHTGGFQRDERRPGAVDVVGAPSPEPGAARLLLLQKIRGG